MGRPENCNCCDDFGNPPLPPITSCDDVICIALIDENNKSNGRDTVDAKFAEWVKAFPNRILFVVDVFLGKPNNPDGTPKLYFPDGWDDHNYAFNLRGEFQRGVSVPEFCNRDNGDVGLATDVWAALSTIVADRGLTTDFNDATEVSVFVDISRSMPEGTVQAAYNLLVSELESAGKTLVSSISNTEEDYLCPFVTSSCCPNEFVKPLQDLCNVTPTCEPSVLRLTNNSVFGVGPATGRTSFLIREYISYDPDNPPNNGFPPSENWCAIYGGVESVFHLEYAGNDEVVRNTTNPNALAAETNAQQLVVVTNASNSLGSSLDFVDIKYTIEYSDDNGLTWTLIQNLGTVPAGQTLTKKFLVDNYNWSSAFDTTEHNLLGPTVSDYTDTSWLGRSRAKRVYDRLFKLVASAPDYPALGSVELEFTLEEYRVGGQCGGDPPPPPGEITGAFVDTDSHGTQDQALARAFYYDGLKRFWNNGRTKRFMEGRFSPTPQFIFPNGERSASSSIEDFYHKVEFFEDGVPIIQDYYVHVQVRDKYECTAYTISPRYTPWSNLYPTPKGPFRSGQDNTFGPIAYRADRRVDYDLDMLQDIGEFAQDRFWDAQPAYWSGPRNSTPPRGPEGKKGRLVLSVDDPFYDDPVCSYRYGNGVFSNTQEYFRLLRTYVWRFNTSLQPIFSSYATHGRDNLFPASNGQATLQYWQLEHWVSNREFRLVVMLPNADNPGIVSNTFHANLLGYNRWRDAYLGQWMAYVPST